MATTQVTHLVILSAAKDLLLQLPLPLLLFLPFLKGICCFFALAFPSVLPKGIRFTTHPPAIHPVPHYATA